ncbi:tRNA-intron lyase [Nanoarchaeota archaeon NZ13-N]|nr:MAG: tRNA-intron lyase [Nanoarchaeota archaeon NZ13-N]
MKVIYKDGIIIGTSIPFLEVLYLSEKGKVEIVDINGNKKEVKEILKEKGLEDIYLIYKDLRNKGYRVGTGLKFGGNLRVYEKPSDEHSKWICFPARVNEEFTMYDFLAKNRVAHSTRKALLVGVIDGRVRYLEIRWKRL